MTKLDMATDTPRVTEADWEAVERAIWPDGPAHGHGSGAYAALKARVQAESAAEYDDGLREALLMFGHEYDVDGRNEWHSFNCTYRKTWAMGGDDESPCIAVRAALAKTETDTTLGDSAAARRLHRVLVDKGINAMDAALLIEAVEDAVVR